ncbi:arsenate reductase [Neptunitalea chrysea]|uniref:Arsenate reductase n=1 Tax=Neptunitalea chrysea TaxID=1647581 RepID=A0A9W6B681_9FLAO|nr:ArsC/Spx/MgsR family protein [Neptunitalea chrysea]GLB53388.1 arsenate reductase [Neptunitalea chrysea]
MKKIYYLSTCDTCKKILKEWEPLLEGVELQDIKKTALQSTDVDIMYELAGSFEALLNKRAQLYKQRNLKDKKLTETDIRNLLLEHYTFLKRPVLVLENRIFVGNAKKTVADAKAALHE